MNAVEGWSRLSNGMGYISYQLSFPWRWFSRQTSSFRSSYSLLGIEDAANWGMCNCGRVFTIYCNEGKVPIPDVEQTRHDAKKKE